MISSMRQFPFADSTRQPETTELRTDSELDSRLFASWQELVESASDNLVEMHPEVILGERQPHSRRIPGLLLHTSRKGGEMANLAVLFEKTVSLPLLPGLPWRAPLRGLRLAGSRLLGADADTAIPAFAASLEKLLGSPGADRQCLLFENLPATSPWWSAFARSRRLRTVPLVAPETHWFLRVPDSPSDYWSQFSSKTRYNFRKKRRRFEHQWEAVRDVSQVESFLTDVSIVSANSWQGKRLGLRVTQDESMRHQFCKLADLRALRCYLLRSRGEPAAFCIGTQWNGRFLLEETGYDTRYAASSPGTVLWQCILEDMLQSDTPELIDFGFGDGHYKRLFGNHSTQSGTLLVVNRRVGTTLAVCLNRIGAVMERGVRAGLRSGGLNRWA